jgi:hypothetical protein
MSLSASEIQKRFLRQPQQDRIIQDAAIGVGDQDVLALPDRQLRQIARRQHLDESGGIRPGDSTWRSTATSHRIASFTRFQKFCTGSPKSRGMYMWLYTENALRAPPHRRVEIGGFADLRAEAEII